MEDMNDPNEVIAVCTECKSDQPSNRVERDPFYLQGNNPVCRYCGGVTILVERGHRDNALDQASRQRGLFSGDNE